MAKTRSFLLPPLLALLAACGGTVPDDAAGTIKVGAIFDLTGATADVGTPYAEGIQGYFAWLAEQGGIDGRPVRLIYQDYGYKVDRAEQLYTQFVQEGAVAFLGWGTGDTEALRRRIADDRIPFTSASYSHVLGDPREAPYNFLVGTSYSDQFLIVLDWILENHAGDEPPRVAMMHHPSPFGLSPYEQGGRDYAAGRGIVLTAHEMARGSTDYTAELLEVRESGAGYVVFQNTSGPVSLALKNARDLGFELPLYCLNWCTNELLTELAGEAAEGLVGAMTFAPAGDGVEGLTAAAAYLESRGSSLEEKGLHYGQGWVTASVMVEGIRRALTAGGELDGESIKAALETLQDFDTGGVTEPITYGPEDHLGARGLRLYEVHDGSWRPLSEHRAAPSWDAP